MSLHTSTTRRFGYWSLVFLCLCLGVFVLARAALEVNPIWRLMAWAMALSVVGLTYGVLYRMGGWHWVRHFFFPVVFFLVAVPWHMRLEVPFIQTLTQLNATITVEALAFLNVVAVRLGNLILIEPGMVGVQEACSGIRSFQSTLMVALFLGELFRFNLWRRLVFVVLGASCSMFFNILRTSFLVWSCNEEGLSAVDKFHDPAGWAVFAASFATLALIGWRLKRGDAREKAEGGKRRVESGKEVPTTKHTEHTEIGTESFQPATTRAVVRGPGSVVRGPWSVVMVSLLLSALVATELGLRWWFAGHSRGVAKTPEWTVPAAVTEQFSALTISKEVRAMLAYNEGDGWEWQGRGGERWQAFYFVWEPPSNLGRKIIATSGSFGHQPEVCFTMAGMQLRQMYGYRRYVANGVPLVFKVYEFVDRNLPIFVFAGTWERGVEQMLDERAGAGDHGSFAQGFRNAITGFKQGDNGVSDEVRVFKLGVWGPRTIGEAEAAFQQQLNQLVQPVARGG